MLRALKREEGAAIQAAIAVLAVGLIVSAGVASGAVSLSHTANDDRNAKRALAAAEAGVQAATYRINKLAPLSSMCLVDVPVLPVAGECPAFSQDLGNNASYTYHVTPVLNLTDRCAGLPVHVAGGTVTVAQRCVTSTGLVNGVKRRVQTRVAAFDGLPLFPLGGILGVQGVDLRNAGIVNGRVGSNAQITLGNSVTVTGNLEIASSSPNPVLGSSSSAGSVVRRTPEEGPWVLGPVDVGNSVSVNDNQRISNGIANPKVTPYDASTNVTFNPGTRVLAMGNNSSLTLGGGTYNFCSLTIANGAVLSIANGARVRIFIDSPDRPGSNCPAGSGVLTTNQHATFSNPGGPEDLQIYVYGWSNGQNLVDLQNSSQIKAAIYAPNSKIEFKNAANLVGGISARYVEFKNTVNFAWASTLTNLSARTLRLFHRTAWNECRREATVAGDPESGC